MSETSAGTVSIPSADALHGQLATPRRRLPRWVLWTGAAVLVVLAVAFIAVAYVIHNAEPILRRRVIADLEERFHSPVELDALHVSMLGGIEVSGSGLRILYLAGPNEPDAQRTGAPPMISVDRFEFHSGLRELLEPTMRVVTVQVDGMRLNIPPKQDRGALFPKEDTDRPKERGQPRLGLVVDKIVCRDVVLTIETDKPGKAPLVFVIHNVTLRDVGAQKPFLFESWLANAKPAGDIHSTGHFGPWQGGEPRDTPVDGQYSFTNADLGTIKGITGTLSSTGSYSGTLGEIGVVGATDTPNFALDVSEHPADLRTEFNATVDGTSGDTKLNSVKATLLHTVLQVSGTVMRSSDVQGDAGVAIFGDGGEIVPGHFIDISVASDQARIEDILTLGAKTSPPLMQGAMTLRAHLNIPPGHVSVSKKMRVQGSFTIRGATFSNAKWQETVDKLSMRARGRPDEANAKDAKTVTSEMSGSFSLANALIDVRDLNYRMPGAQVNLVGQYSMDGEKFDFDGTVRTHASASAMLTGWKSIVAKPLDPLFRKDGAGLEVPIKIGGTKSDPKLGLDLGKMFSRHGEQKPPESGKQPPEQRP